VNVLLFVGTNFHGFYKIHWSLDSWIRGFKHYMQQSVGKLYFHLRNNSWKPYVYIVFTMGRFLCHEVLPMVKIILIYDRLNLWRHRQFITICYQFVHIRIEIIHGSHMYILFLPWLGLYVSFLFHELFRF
jgi:hypothetical protein